MPPIVAILASQLQERVQATDVNRVLDSVQNISTITLLYELPWKPLGTRVVTGFPCTPASRGGGDGFVWGRGNGFVADGRQLSQMRLCDP